MCGIAGIHRLTGRHIPHLDRLADNLLLGIEDRGMDATGYVAILDDGTTELQKASCDATKFVKERRGISPDARTVLLHTRWATQGSSAFPENNHPVMREGIYVVHNGHIWNDDLVLAAAGMSRFAAVDSAVIPALVASRGWDSAPSCLIDLSGDLAIAMINRERPRDLILARGQTSPLVAIKTRDYIVWASTYDAIKKAWAKVLGTPPAPEKIIWLNEGSAIVARHGTVDRVQWATFVRPPRVTTTPVTDLDRYRYSWAKNDDPALDYVACDDCGNWEREDDLETVDFKFGISNTLCKDCLHWATKAGMVDPVSSSWIESH